MFRDCSYYSRTARAASKPTLASANDAPERTAESGVAVGVGVPVDVPVWSSSVGFGTAGASDGRINGHSSESPEGDCVEVDKTTSAH